MGLFPIVVMGKEEFLGIAPTGDFELELKTVA